MRRRQRLHRRRPPIRRARPTIAPVAIPLTSMVTTGRERHEGKKADRPPYPLPGRMMTFFALLPDAGTRLTTLAIELPRSITPAVAGLTVGLFVGVVGAIAVILLVGRSDRSGARRSPLAADEVVFIPPYGTMQRDTPLPPRVFANATPGWSGQLPIAGPVARAYAHAYANAPNAHRAPSPHDPVPGYGFRPSSALSARVLAKMRYADEDLDAGWAPPAPSSIPVELPSSIDVDMTDDADAVLVAPVVMVSAERSAAEKSAPHPLGIIKSASAAMRPASIADLSFDDGPTEIGEPYFDEASHPPAPPRRTDPPKIRAIAPVAPRLPQQTPRMPQVATTKNDRQHP